MSQRKRLQLIDAIARAIDATNEAMRLALELEAEPDVDSTPTPPNVVRDPGKTGPRLPFKTDTPPPRHSALMKRTTAYSFNAFTGERALRHVKDAYANAESDAERVEVVALMQRLAAQGLFTIEDVAEYLTVPEMKKS